MIGEKEISKELIAKGLQQGIINIIKNPNDGCISAMIGDFWFYFANDDYETIEDYKLRNSHEDMINDIYNAINDEPINGETEDEASEWLYYRAVLLETANKK